MLRCCHCLQDAQQQGCEAQHLHAAPYQSAHCMGSTTICRNRAVAAAGCLVLAYAIRAGLVAGAGTVIAASQFEQKQHASGLWATSAVHQAKPLVAPYLQYSWELRTTYTNMHRRGHTCVHCIAGAFPASCYERQQALCCCTAVQHCAHLALCSKAAASSFTAVAVFELGIIMNIKQPSPSSSLRRVVFGPSPFCSRQSLQQQCSSSTAGQG
jgi:hypothetical protein